VSLIPETWRTRFDGWLNDRPDEAVLRHLFTGMLVITATVLGLDYFQLGDFGEPVGIAMPATSTEPRIITPANDEKQHPGPMQRPDTQMQGRMSFELVGDGRLMAVGTIEPGIAKAFAAEVEKRGSYVKTIVLRSPGGSVADALEMGRLIRAKKFSTEVEAGRYCTSSCPLVFASGVERRVGDKAAIGVHQVFAMSRDGISPATGMADVQHIAADCQKYLRDMGVDLAVWTHAMETPKEQLYYFKRDELMTLKLATDVGNADKPGKPVAAEARAKS
jgi:hypothetical protein